jgi:hypothetical protein
MLSAMSSKPAKKGLAVLKVAVGVLLGLVELNTDHHGLVSPTSGQAVGFDIWGAAVYLFCIWAIVTGVRTLVSRPGASLGGVDKASQENGRQ